MRKGLMEWVWRLAVLCALGWIGMQLERLHEDIVQPPDDTPTVAADADDLRDSLDEIHDQLDGLTRRVDAIMAVMSREGP